MDNNNTVGHNCLTFIAEGITKNETYTIRYKLNTKFVQSMESLSACGKSGRHIKDSFQNPQPILWEAIEKSLDTGLHRLETTFSLYGISKMPEEDHFKDHISYLGRLFENTRYIIRYNPIQTKFNLICEHVPFNLCLYHIKEKLAFTILFFNSLSGRRNGFSGQNAISTNFRNALLYYTNNELIYLLLLEGNTTNNTVSIQQNIYLRIATNKEFYTYLPQSKKGLTTASIKPNTPQPKDVGLATNSTFNFILPIIKLPSFLKSTSIVNIVFKHLALPFLDFSNTTVTLPSINMAEEEDKEDQTFEHQYKEKLDHIDNTNAELE